ncbi:MAG: hypothetical protein ABSH38_12560 [Verrucomicrobiota bacterium]|jgi:hypothetical protein
MKNLLPVLLAATCAMADTPADFPYPVQFELGEAEFAPGDNITITQVRGTSAAITTNQTYCVDGTYTLASRDQANLCLFATTLQNVATPTDPQQTVRITNGTGTFHLVKTMTAEGYLHVTFYPVVRGSGFGGVYFGQGQWVLKKKGWSYLSNASDMGGASNSAVSSLAGANKALFEYLGDPVPPPSRLDARYTTDGLSNAVQLAASKAGITLKRMVIDDSEFPGVIAIVVPEGDSAKIDDQLRAMAGYEYNGSVSSSTCKVFNLVPWRAFPTDVVKRIGRRLGLREQVLYDKTSAQQ